MQAGHLPLIIPIFRRGVKSVFVKMGKNLFSLFRRRPMLLTNAAKSNKINAGDPRSVEIRSERQRHQAESAVPESSSSGNTPAQGNPPRAQLNAPYKSEPLVRSSEKRLNRVAPRVFIMKRSSRSSLTKDRFGAFLFLSEGERLCTVP